MSISASDYACYFSYDLYVWTESHQRQDFLKLLMLILKNGVLTIHHSKKDNSRLVPMSDFLTKRCRTFSKKVHSHPGRRRLLFSSPWW